VLGPVVLEDAAQVGQAADRDDVADEDRRCADPLDQPEEEGRAELVLDQAGEADRDDEEEADRERQRERDRQPPDPAADLFGSPSSSSSSWALAEIASALKPIFSDSPRATTPRRIGSRQSRWR
jgi:hypothetical protein